jgi:heme-degrading monooxygenase HmoA
MAFSVINTVRAAKDELPAMVADMQRLGLDDLRAQPGFRSARLLVAEDRSEAVMITEWDSREHFLAHRQSEAGRLVVEGAVHWHPRISFYEVAAAIDPVSR